MNKYFPHFTFDVKDDSLHLLRQVDNLPLYRPVFAMKTEKGEVGVPVWCEDLAAARNLYGDRTFDPNDSEYFSLASVFLHNILPHSGAFIIRVDSTDPDNSPMVAASLVLTLKFDNTNNKWWFEKRALNAGESIASVKNASIPDPVNDVYTIPFAVFQASSVGKFGNNYGVYIDHGVSYQSSVGEWVNTGMMDYAEIKRFGSYKYKIGFVELNSDSSTPAPIRTKYMTDMVTFSTNEATVDTILGSTLGFSVQMDRNFGEAKPAPINGEWLNNNIQFALGLLASKARSTGITYGTNLSLADFIEENVDVINIFSLTTQILSNNTETTLDIGDLLSITIGNTSEDDVVINHTTKMYLEGGSDGTLDIGGSDINDLMSTVSEAVANVWNLTTNPEILDAPRYPFNHLIDVGYATSVKNAMISMLRERGDIEVCMTSWQYDVTQSEVEAVTATNSMMTQIVAHKESVIYGTDACRGTVFSQTSQLFGDLYRKPVPTTIWYANKLATMHNVSYIKEFPEGESAQVEILRADKFNWTPYTDLEKSNLWDTSINYCQYFNRKNLHFPAVKSVYAHESSVITNASYVRMIVYINQIFPALWAKFANDTGPKASIYAKVLVELDAHINHMLNGHAQFSTRMYQTEAEEFTGFEHHIEIKLANGMGQRIWHVDLIAERL